MKNSSVRSKYLQV